MTEVARALLLPDLVKPSVEYVRDLALFWDGIVCPDYEGIGLFPADEPLLQEGVVQELRRELKADEIFPPGVEGIAVDQDRWGYRVRKDEEGLPHVDIVPIDPEESDRQRRMDLPDFTDANLEDFAAITFGQHLGYVDDSLSMAAHNSFAPISHSIGGHLAAVIGSSSRTEDSAPAQEAALLSVVVQSFSIGPDVTSEEILSFRSRNSKTQSRLRASLVDLASQLRSDGPPEALLAEARDVYRNRVEPALGDLEVVLKESRISFFMKSVLGATAIAMAPVEPVSSSVGAARVLGQSIDYTYSRSRLVREHPYGYLHQLKEHFPEDALGSPPEIETAIMSPRESLRDLWQKWWFAKRDGQEKA